MWTSWHGAQVLDWKTLAKDNDGFCSTKDFFTDVLYKYKKKNFKN